MSAPGWARALLARLAGQGRSDEVVGDLEEAHRIRLRRHRRPVATLLTAFEALDVALALIRHRRRSGRARRAHDTDGPSVAKLPRPLLPISPVDVKLGVRLLMKQPALTAVSALGILVAVAIGASVFGALHTLTSSSLPFPDGDRIVTVQNVTAMGLELDRRTHLHDLETWRRDVPALQGLGAYRIVTRNVIGEDGGVTPTRVVEMTAAGFRIPAIPPLLGRPLVAEDERPEAPAVAVIGHGVWRDRFGSSPDVLGRALRIGATRHAIVGVMPEAFVFPINNRVWTPLRLDPADFEPGLAPPVDVFGRLAPGATREEAQAQLDVVAGRRPADHPVRAGELRTRVFPYAKELFWGSRSWLLHGVQTLVSLLLVVIAVNVAALIYARTLARSGEIAVRTALGASRGRIAGQLFVEAFLLSGLATVGGLVVSAFILRHVGMWVHSSGGEQAPFWWTFSLSPATVGYGLALAVLAALIIGVAPAVGATGRQLRGNLQSVGSGFAAAGPGRTWTLLITLQVAVAVAILPVAFRGVTASSTSTGRVESPFPLGEVVVTGLHLDDENEGLARNDEHELRYVERRDELVRRFQALPGVDEVVLTAPAPWRDPDLPFEIDGGPVRTHASTPMESASTGHRVGRSRVTPDFFDAFDMPMVAGRRLHAGDAGSDAPPVVVNETFVDLVVGGGNVLGRRIRFPGSDPGAEEAPWHEIVGVAPNLWVSTANPEARAYIPLDRDPRGPVDLAVRVRGRDAASVVGSLRSVAVEVDPMLRLGEVSTLEDRLLQGGGMNRMLIGAIVALGFSTLGLAVAGLFALMSFTVVRRRREIGIRTALGASPERVVVSVLGRAGRQLALGIVVGLAAAWGLDHLLGGELLGTRKELLLPGIAALMAVVGALAAWGPARRGLRVEPSEALRAE